jgi:hypothetical protein
MRVITIKNTIITERGWIVWHICAARCRFRRNTLIERGDRRVVVGTVGLLYIKPDDAEPETVGHARYYETAVFRAKRAGHYWDADTSKQLFDFEASRCLNRWKPLNSDILANDMHDAVVREFAEKLERGERLR